ncbi:MAG: Na(+)-translocating NADH-quinone reductase subunit A [Desulfocapsaceae bacterium]|nr:Na(+)-translocating NADH-quinone reductase subunit A [Desulfocapsaceae bacterium]
MKRIEIKKGLDVPVTGEPLQNIQETIQVSKVALVGDDYIGMKPTMEVTEGDRVKTGQLLFTDKKNEGIRYTSPATGKILAVNRGAKRKFESVVIEVEDDEHISFLDPEEKPPGHRQGDEIRKILLEAGMWTSFRTRPFGKIPKKDAEPAALFITAMDSRPLAADPKVIIDEYAKEFSIGLTILASMTSCPTYLCIAADAEIAMPLPSTMEIVEFAGPHPAGLPSTHMHMLDHATESRILWHIEYQDVIGIGHLLSTGQLPTEKVIALAGPGVEEPKLIKTRWGGNIADICNNQLIASPTRIISGSVIDGRKMDEFHQYVGRYHNQISVLHEGSGRGLFNWGAPGSDRFSIKPAFISAMDRTRKFAMNTALWGGERAMYPIDSYDRVMPLDIVPLALLKSLSSGDTEKARNLGALELVEDDVALLSFICPGKSNFAPILRRVLTEIELEG